MTTRTRSSTCSQCASSASTDASSSAWKFASVRSIRSKIGSRKPLCQECAYLETNTSFLSLWSDDQPTTASRIRNWFSRSSTQTSPSSTQSPPRRPGNGQTPLPNFLDMSEEPVSVLDGIANRIIKIRQNRADKKEIAISKKRDLETSARRAKEMENARIARKEREAARVEREQVKKYERKERELAKRRQKELARCKKAAEEWRRKKGDKTGGREDAEVAPLSVPVPGRSRLSRPSLTPHPSEQSSQTNQAWAIYGDEGLLEIRMSRIGL